MYTCICMFICIVVCSHSGVGKDAIVRITRAVLGLERKHEAGTAVYDRVSRARTCCAGLKKENEQRNYN